jgi:hypothetical protein
MKIKKIFLLTCFVAIPPIALGYGFSPQWFVRQFFGVQALDLNVAHILRAVMGLYLAMAGFWLYSAFSDKYRNAGVLSVVVFDGGLLSGRIVSLLTDGVPSTLLQLYTAVELVLLPFAIWVFLRRDERS